MEKLTEVLAMNGFAAYVWPSFLLVGLVLLSLYFVSIKALHRANKSLNQLQDTTNNET